MPAPKSMSVATAKVQVIALLGAGALVDDAMASVGRVRKTYENWRANDPDFAKRVDDARAKRNSFIARDVPELNATLGFEEWRLKFLGRETYDHQRQWIDILEERSPKVLHQSIKYEAGKPNRILINTPPFHAKSTVITQEYVTYRICMNPNVRVLIVSKTQEKAKAFLHSVKRMLTEPQFSMLQAAYAPPDGFKPKRGGGDAWMATKIYVAGRGIAAADPAAKDPTCEALGIGGHIYGARADLIILDDCVTLDNSGNHAKQVEWLNQEVMSRAKNGKIIVVGTRVASVDLYSELRNGDNYISGRSPWTYLGQPAVLEYGETPEDWVTLWPRSSQPLDEENADAPDEEGLYPAWDGRALSDVRESVRPRTWSLVYMQQEVAEDTVFHPSCVWGSVDRRRKPGPLTAGAWGHPRNGSEGMHSILSIDPAGTGEAFMLAVAVDRVTKDRWVCNAWSHHGATPAWYAEKLEQLYPEYGFAEIVVEQNGYASWIIQDTRIVSFCRNRGILITPHYTSRNKQDPNFGVASIAPLFGSVRRIHEGAGREVFNDDNIIHLPDPAKSEGVKLLIEQLIAWQPGKLGKDLRQDGPMSLWFAELRARIVANPTSTSKTESFTRGRFLTPRQLRSRMIIPRDRYFESLANA